MQRRTALQMIGGAAAFLALPRRLWSDARRTPDDFFVFVHASGGWDVTLWSDPRNERRGIIEPPSSDNTDIGGIKQWKQVRLEGNTATFEVIAAGNGGMRLGPAIGELIDLHDRITIINGIAMNTVSHDDGTVYSATGRHRSGGIIPESSIDVLVANELGTDQLMPDVSVRFPSNYVAEKLDRRSIPLRVANIEAITKSFQRSETYLRTADRTAITAALRDEAHELAAESESYHQLESQHEALPQLLTGDFTTAFSPKQLQASYPQFNYKMLRTQSSGALSAAFAIEAMKRNVVRCVSFGLGGLDTHTTNYRQHAHVLQELFGVLATLMKTLDETPHPTLHGTKLSERTHVLVVSEFCRTPQINLAGGRDHYPNNSALVISPRFRGGRVFGQTDAEQLLPAEGRQFTDAKRAISPPDVLATFLGAFGIDPRRYMRDGEVMREMLV